MIQTLTQKQITLVTKLDPVVWLRVLRRKLVDHECKAKNLGELIISPRKKKN